MSAPICRSILVIQTIPAGAAVAGGVIQFPDKPELREPGVKVYGIEVLDAGMVTNTPGGGVVISSADILGLTATFIEASTQRFQQIPANFWNIQFLAGLYRETTPFSIDLQRSSVQWTITAAVATVFNIPWLFHYYKEGDNFHP